ncbi:hypothetical protein CALVIDRAFT_525290 [Calocera viscosa TUFC12733]|uniref:ATP-dependent DNA helicase n=1 Tax=Calocera viscosa (strain TUFC12733) TaxID=1330018 RepID=A0A167QGY7_CALVF|nr:hypothetical protein CALVIDRAFT_525290 [Calocera viscosa TUFC12733]
MYRFRIPLDNSPEERFSEMIDTHVQDSLPSLTNLEPTAIALERPSGHPPALEGNTLSPMGSCGSSKGILPTSYPQVIPASPTWPREFSPLSPAHDPDINNECEVQASTPLPVTSSATYDLWSTSPPVEPPASSISPKTPALRTSQITSECEVQASTPLPVTSSATHDLWSLPPAVEPVRSSITPGEPAVHSPRLSSTESNNGFRVPDLLGVPALAEQEPSPLSRATYAEVLKSRPIPLPPPPSPNSILPLIRSPPKDRSDVLAVVHAPFAEVPTQIKDLRRFNFPLAYYHRLPLPADEDQNRASKVLVEVLESMDKEDSVRNNVTELPRDSSPSMDRKHVGQLPLEETVPQKASVAQNHSKGVKPRPLRPGYLKPRRLPPKPLNNVTTTAVVQIPSSLMPLSKQAPPETSEVVLPEIHADVSLKTHSRNKKRPLNPASNDFQPNQPGAEMLLSKHGKTASKDDKISEAIATSPQSFQLTSLSTASSSRVEDAISMAPHTPSFQTHEVFNGPPSTSASAVIPPDMPLNKTGPKKPESARLHASTVSANSGAVEQGTIPVFDAVAPEARNPPAISVTSAAHGTDDRQVSLVIAGAQPNGMEVPTTTQSSGLQFSLTEEQKYIFNLVKEERSVFITGPAEIIKYLRKLYEGSPTAVAVTASTGVAACNIDGTTLHRWAGIGLGLRPAKYYADDIRWNQPATLDRWKQTRYLIIEEIDMLSLRENEVSMISDEFFDKLEDIARQLRGNSQPFGGICLPPVNDRGSDLDYAFKAQTWDSVVPLQYTLTRVFRQTNGEFVEALAQARVGRVEKKQAEVLCGLGKGWKVPPGIVPTYLRATRKQVDEINSGQLIRRCKGLIHEFYSLDDKDLDYLKSLDKQRTSSWPPSTLRLGNGARVMCIRNFPDLGLANGHQGTVIGFRTRENWSGLVTGSWRPPPANAQGKDARERHRRAQDGYDSEEEAKQDRRMRTGLPLVRMVLGIQGWNAGRLVVLTKSSDLKLM